MIIICPLQATLGYSLIYGMSRRFKDFSEGIWVLELAANQAPLAASERVSKMSAHTALNC